MERNRHFDRSENSRQTSPELARRRVVSSNELKSQDLPKLMDIHYTTISPSAFFSSSSEMSQLSPVSSADYVTSTVVEKEIELEKEHELLQRRSDARNLRKHEREMKRVAKRKRKQILRNEIHQQVGENEDLEDLLMKFREAKIQPVEMEQTTELLPSTSGSTFTNALRKKYSVKAKKSPTFDMEQSADVIPPPPAGDPPQHLQQPRLRFFHPRIFHNFDVNTEVILLEKKKLLSW
jgi:hypothetical protein